MIEKKEIIDGQEVVIKRYPRSMTGWKLRKQLGIGVHGSRNFRVRKKFLIIPREHRLEFLIKKASGEALIPWSRMGHMRRSTR